MTAKILVPLSGTKRDEPALATAFAAAAPLEGHVAGLFVHSDPREGLTSTFTGYPATVATLSVETVEAIIDTQTKLSDEAEQRAHRAFLAAAEKYGAQVVDRPKGNMRAITCAFRARLGFIPHVIAAAARLCDLAVFGPIAVMDGPDFRDAFVNTLTKIQRPVILSQQPSSKPFARHIAIGWDGSMAAAHAITAALPYLKRAASVALLEVTKGKKRPSSLADVREYLLVHDIPHSEHVVFAADESIGEKLLGSAEDVRADLLVMGGYGHAHWQEAIFGGPTQHILSHPTIPLFMMH